MRKYLLITCILYSLIGNANAQQSYSFSSFILIPSSYQELTNDSIVTNYPVANLFMVDELIGETFWFYNLPFTFGGLRTISFGPFGFLRIDNDSSLIIFDGVNTPLSLLDSTSRVSYSITGTTGSLLFKLQYKNVHLDNGQAGNFANFQIWYEQATGIIEFHYGPRSANNATGYTTSNGPQVGIFYAADDFSVCYEKIWCTTDPANPVLNTAANFQFSALPGVPDEGTVYRFTPTFPVSNQENQNDLIFEIYPSPVNSTLEINFKGHQSTGTWISIYDMTGRIVVSKQSMYEVTLLNIDYLKEGMYVCVVENELHKGVKRFVKAN